MRILKALFNLIKRKVGIRSPSQKELDNISKWVIEGLKEYENIPESLKFVDLMQKENKK